MALKLFKNRNILNASLLLVVLASLLLDPASALATENGDASLPTFADFVKTVQNDDASVLRGVYVPNVLALPIVQQSQGNAARLRFTLRRRSDSIPHSGAIWNCGVACPQLPPRQAFPATSGRAGGPPGVRRRTGRDVRGERCIALSGSSTRQPTSATLRRKRPSPPSRCSSASITATDASLFRPASKLMAI